MAGHAHAAAELSDETDADPAPADDDDADTGPDAGRRVQRAPKKSVVAVALAASVALAILVGWLGFGTYQRHERLLECERFVAVGRQAAVNLTTIDFNEADADVARVLESATGTFRDDFQKRAQPFIDVVRKAKSRSVGVVTEAGLERLDGDHAQILVAVQVKSSTEGGPESEPRDWRMRIDVQKSGSDLKLANVQFVP